MYRIYAEFDSRTAADRAADRLRSSVPGLGRITVQAKKSSFTKDESIAVYAAENAAFSTNSFFSGSAFPLASALSGERTLTHERYHDSQENMEHILSAEGPRHCAEYASHLLRSFGGRGIMTSGQERL